VTDDQITAFLAERVMGWSVGPERFMMGGRRWIPRWRFQPATRLGDALRLLERLAPQEYAMGAASNGGYWVRVRIAGITGEATESSQARAMMISIARAIGLEA
jgi:hypothetical protein